jgi:hypothetical protein
MRRVRRIEAKKDDEMASPGADRSGGVNSWCQDEQSIGEMLSDPIVRAVMEADGVGPENLASLLSKLSG